MTEPELVTVAAAHDEFDDAWNDPRTTSIALPPVDVNKTLAEQYAVTPRTRMTRAQVWDMEMKKAWDPLTYIPYIVSEGRSWSATSLPDGRRHLRSSIQKAWLNDERGRVLEGVFTDSATQRVVFLGRARMEGPDGETLLADPYQPLFHVEHGVAGTDDEPMNVWRIVLLTEKPDPRFVDAFKAQAAAGGLPGFLEIYLAHDLGVHVRRTFGEAPHA
ncbi:hypothetical protein [Wenjunlia tyrosinilytica]|uniref:Uncharacterized protein n=1 Tax=Wenjunlia tyrosinilytica TaxID=1544741 RepID=A0A917ZXP2_9ACTN|nr:hypothetical protein [Wenjunlia tyrosinilytica]GGP00489.1 hypothetical protein GCM10012280_69370 [Wenjunlia tyrosinilytica]